MTKKPPVNLEQLAQRLVSQSAGIKEGDLVFISGGRQGPELLENIAVEVRKAGAFPLVALNSDRMTKRLFFDVPEKLDTQADALGAMLADKFDAIITVDANLDEAVLSGADPKRQAARATANQAIGDVMVRRKVRQSKSATGCIQPAGAPSATGDRRRADEDVLGRRQHRLREPRGKSSAGQERARGRQ